MVELLPLLSPKLVQTVSDVCLLQSLYSDISNTCLLFTIVVGVDLHPSQPKVSRNHINSLLLLSRLLRDLNFSFQGFEENEPITIDLVRDIYKVKSVFVQGDASKEETWERVITAALDLDGHIDM